ncbi:MAG: DUF1775 domain-containing protein [Herbiconiux sp.]|uniref:YcnI family copper-binding membrane protein n=1 Tax=Herbiconiux sp. TaxID=1871186 RepID=UPI001226B4FC|nr:YcnI family protein [Herbiconiux sp.]TAJ48410.1 MAG: DUF1775 domain-containing protein [Herbiconiux sp.]
MQKNTFARAGRTGAAATAVTLAAFALVLAAPLSASAHVHVDPGQAAPGGYSTLTFKVPNESATASTTSVVVDLPTDTPLTYVAYQPVPGWTAVVTTAALPAPVTVGDATITEAAVSVTWTADAGSGIADGQYQLFPISAGPIPDVGSIVLPVHQIYSDGSVVDWNEPTPASGEEPEHPAPTLYINEAPPADEDAGSASVTPTDAAGAGSGSESASAPAASVAADAAATSSLALGLGIGGFVLGAAALIVAVVTSTRRRSSPAGEAPGSMEESK